jgi:hypothetical protein
MKLIDGCGVLYVRLGWCANGIKLAWNISRLLNVRVFQGFLEWKITISRMAAGWFVRGLFLAMCKDRTFQVDPGYLYLNAAVL